MSQPDNPEAIWIPAHVGVFYTPAGHGGVPNRPRAWCLHTPEETMDDNEATPRWFQNPVSKGSTHYYISGPEGNLYQCVEERCFAFANGLIGKPWPSWANQNTSLNWQTLSVEIEGFAASIHNTLTRHGGQWKRLVSLLKDGCDKYDIPQDREHIIGHYQVSNERSDPGLYFPWDALIADLNTGTENEMVEHRHNWEATWFNGQVIGANQGPQDKYEMQARADFNLPEDAKAVEFQVILKRGHVRWFDGNSFNEDCECIGDGVFVIKCWLAWDTVHNGTVDFRVEEEAEFVSVRSLRYFT